MNEKLLTRFVGIRLHHLSLENVILLVTHSDILQKPQS